MAASRVRIARLAYMLHVFRRRPLENGPGVDHLLEPADERDTVPDKLHVMGQLGVAAHVSQSELLTGEDPRGGEM